MDNANLKEFGEHFRLKPLKCDNDSFLTTQEIEMQDSQEVIVALFRPELLEKIDSCPDLGDVRIEADGTFQTVPKRLFGKRKGTKQFVTIVVPYNNQVLMVLKIYTCFYVPQKTFILR